MLLTVIGIALIGVVCVTLFKEIKPSFSVLISLVTSIILLTLILTSIGNLVSKFSVYLSKLSLAPELFNYMLKVIGVSFIVEFVVDIVEEAGCKSIANKVKILGKIILAGISLPVLFNLLDLIMDLV